MKSFAITCFGDPIQVREESLNGPLGSWNESTGEILIEKDQPEIGKYVTLIHELLHLAETMCLQAGVIKRRVAHKFIGSAPMILFLCLTEAGFFRREDIDVDDILEFVDDNLKPIGEGP